MTSTHKPPIAIVGVSCLFPGSQDERGFWHDILAGRDLISDVPAHHWLIEDFYDPDPSAPDKTYAKRGGFLPHVDFDPMGWGVPPSIVPATDTAQLLALIVAQRVLNDATNGQFSAMNKDAISIILGVTSAQELLGSMVARLQRPIWVKSLREAGLPESKVQQACDRMSSHYTPWQEATFPGLLGNVVAGRIANRLDLGGTNCVTDAACASAFSALSMACGELYLGDSDLVVTGGVDVLNDIFMYMCFSKTPALSPTGDCRPFSDRADGTMLGEGLGMVALKRLEDAERDGDKVYAVLRGIGSSSDGRAKSVYAPLPEGQAKAMRRAYEKAGYGPETVELVEAHGTGTKAGDKAEFLGLRQVFGAVDGPRRQWCSLGSVKSQIGHTKAAAGAAGLFKAVMALHHKVLPPTIKVDQVNPGLDIETSPFNINTRARPWVRGDDHPRRASVSSFGFGGSNFHLTLEEYEGPAPRPARKRTANTELVVWSGADGAAIVDQLQALKASDLSAAGSLRHLAWSTAGSFDASAAARLAIVATDEADLATKLDKAIELVKGAGNAAASSPIGIWFGAGKADGKTAFVFPGQGSQYLHMGADVAMNWRAALGPWDTAAGLDLDADQRLHDVVFADATFSDEASVEQQKTLTATQWAQPAIGVTSLSYLELMKKVGVEADCTAGHSFGEVTALHAAGAIDAKTMLQVARKRGELMAEAAANPGAMTAVVADIDKVRAVLEETGIDVVVANHNSPKQVVLSGRVEGIDAIEAALKSRRIRARRLPVATAFHSEVVAAASVPFGKYLAKIKVKKPHTEVWANSEAAPYAAKPAAIRKILGAQIKRPVRFVEQVQAMWEGGARTFVEVGPGSVLSGLVGRILKGKEHVAVALDRKGKNGVDSLHEALGQLVAAGLTVDLRALWADVEVPVDPAATARPKLAMPICGANYGKPYPPKGGAAALPAPNPEQAPQVEVREVVKEVVKEVQVPVAVPTPGAAPQAGGTDGWIAAYQQIQTETAQAHTAWQSMMTQAQMAFLDNSERAFAGLSAMVTGTAAPSMPLQARQLSVPAIAPPAIPAPVAVAPAPFPVPIAATATDSATDSATATATATETAAATATDSATETATATATATETATTAVSVDVQALMLEVVAEKTGYPAEMLELSMDLEADLGIDSIKRVEILAAVTESAPGLPEVDTTAMAELRTLGEIVDAVRGAMPQTSASAVASNTGAMATDTSATAGSPAVDVRALLLEVVAEKTGYPAEMLEESMSLEADLGIDSIKRVEILASMTERAPDAPDVDANEMASLQTLGEIIEALSGQHGSAAPAAPTAPTTDAGASITAASSDASRIGRYAVRAVASKASGLAIAGIGAADTLWITDDGRGFATALATELTDRGFRASVTTQPPNDATAVIALDGLALVDGVDDALAIQKRVFTHLRAVAATMASKGGLAVVVQDTGGDFGLSGSDNAWLGGLAGLAKTANLEWPDATVKAIDVACAGHTRAGVAAMLADELLGGGGELEVGLSPAGRVTLVAVESDVDGAARALNPGDVVVVSGGARGVTAATVIALAEATAPRLALLGRTQLGDEPACCAGITDDAGLKRALLDDARASGKKVAPAELGRTVSRVLANREIRATIAAIEAAGGEAMYISVDVQDVEAVSAAMTTVRATWGPINGLIHGAGVLADKLIANKTDAQWDRVVSTKIGGLRALLAATADDPVKLIVLFSSVAARVGNSGQCDYAAANEILNKVAWQLAAQRPACKVRSIGWGPWRGGMVTATLEAHFEAAGVALIPLDVGARALVDEVLSDAGDDVELVIGSAPKRASLITTDSGPSARFDVLVSAASHPHLADHAVRGVPVVPAMQAADWLARGATATRPDLHLVRLRELQVRKGITLDGWHGSGDRFVLASKQLSNSEGAVIGLELRDASGAVRYTAEAEMADAPRAAKQASSAPDGEPRKADVYGGVLFHGPSFQVLRSVAHTEDGVVAEVVGTNMLDWPADKRRLDVALLDGALQAALLWSEVALGGASLPTSIGAIDVYGDINDVQGPLRCVLHGTTAGKTRGVSEIVISAADGAIVASLGGVQTHLLPASRPASADIRD